MMSGPFWTKSKRIALSVAMSVLSVILLAAIASDHPATVSWFGGSRSIATVTGLVGLVTSLLIALTVSDRGSSALIRLDFFLPVLRKIPEGRSPSTSLLARTLRRVLPRSWQSNRRTKKRGWARRTLRRLGPSWLAAPMRRFVQATSLATFVILFMVVCWPYNARPLPPGQSSAGWTFESLDSESGEMTFRRSTATTWLPSPQNVVFVRSESSAITNGSAADPFRVAGQRQASDTDSAPSLLLQPEGELSDSVLDSLFSGEGRFTVFERDPDAWPSHYADNLASKERIPAETFLIIDPLVSLSTAIASRSWVWSLVSAAVILIVCVLVPRGFCGYLCPLGTVIDLFDWMIGKRVKRFRVSGDGWWVHIKYYLLAGTLVAAACGVLVSGLVAAIPVVTRAMLFLVDPLQSGTARGWHLVPAMNLGHVVSVMLFLVVLSLGFLRPRFWCKYVCPSGAVFSIGNLFRFSERKVESSCIHCNKCVEICPFDAIKPDFTTRTTDCTLCQTCGGVCPTHAIKFVERWNVVELKVADEPPTNETSLGRRGFLAAAAGGTAAAVGGVAVAGVTKAWGADLDREDVFLPVRPPGSVPEKEFLQMCIRCGECFKACPNNVLQPEAFQQGLEGLWTPMVDADWAGCESSCNACGQVCPTGAIRALPMEEKRVARMGLAVVNEETCLPYAGREDCDLCVQECDAAGYHAIEYLQVGTEVGEDGQPIEGSGYLAPFVLEDLCVGCGLCQTRCYAINVKSKALLTESAIIVEAGEGKEDRLMDGSYRQARQERAKKTSAPDQTRPDTFFIPEELDADDLPGDNIPPDGGGPIGEDESPGPPVDSDPFGLGI